MRIFSYLIILILVIVGVTFAILNADSVTVHYYIGIKQLPLSLLILCSFAVGIIIGLLVMGWLVLRLKIKNRSLRKRLNNVEKEIQNLRTVPLHSDSLPIKSL